MIALNWRGEKKHNQELENYILFSRHIEDLSPRDRLSALKDCSEEVREEAGYIGVLQKTNQVVEHEKISAN